MFLFIYGGEFQSKECVNVNIRIEVMQIQMVGSGKCWRYCELIQDVFFNSASEEKSEGELVALKCMSNSCCVLAYVNY